EFRHGGSERLGGRRPTDHAGPARGPRRSAGDRSRARGTTTAPPANTVGINQSSVRSVATETGSSPVQLVPGTTLARALYETMTGRRVTLIDSAPGAGKSTLIVDLARWVEIGRASCRDRG